MIWRGIEEPALERNNIHKWKLPMYSYCSICKIIIIIDYVKIKTPLNSNSCFHAPPMIQTHLQIIHKSPINSNTPIFQ